MPISYALDAMTTRAIERRAVDAAIWGIPLVNVDSSGAEGDAAMMRQPRCVETTVVMVGFLAMLNAACQRESTPQPTAAQAQSSPTAPDDKFDFQGGYPTADTVQKAYDAADLNRAIQAYRFFYPSVSIVGTWKGNEKGGTVANQVFALLEGTPQQLVFTPNSDTPYAGLPLDLPIKPADLFRRFPGGHNRHVHGQDAAGLEARVGRLQRHQRTNQHARAREQHERRRDLCHREQPQSPVRATGDADAAARQPEAGSRIR